MRALFTSQQLWNLLFLFCVLSRIFTSIHYIEDIDSLRFAYSIVDEYNILKLQPHFPGYAVFCFIAKILYLIIGNMGVAFSIIGGLSTFLIIYYSLKIMKIHIDSITGIFVSLFIFFNPMFWIMSNRYMPDLMGLSVFIMSFYFLSQKNERNIIIGLLLTGLLAGIRISYLPLLSIPVLYILINNKNKLRYYFAFVIGTVIWLFPMILLTGLSDLINMGFKHSLGHFSDYGGTVLTEPNFALRLQYFFHTIWADGFGGYWINRSFITIILSILLILLLIQLIKNIKFIFKNNSSLKILFFSTIVYIVWILLFQNIIYKSRHVMPLILVLIIFLSVALNNNFLIHNYIKKLHLLLVIIVTAYISINLSFQHKEPSAINKISQYLISKEMPIVLISIPLINYYLKSQNVIAKYIDVENNIEKLSLDPLDNKKNIFIIGNFSEKINGLSTQLDTTFYHNPYVNRMWSEINVFSNTGL